MILYAICGSVLGFMIPCLARRLSKILPASAPEAIWQLLRGLSLPQLGENDRHARRRILRKAYFWRCMMFALVGCGLFIASALHFSSPAIAAFLGTLLLLLEVDYKTLLLPDVLTVPLMIGGFVYAALGGELIIAPESAIGAAVGYLLPTIAGLMLVWRRSDAIGGGDIKLFAAIGAWLGIDGVLYTIVLSCLLFALQALATRQKIGAFGPAISLAAIIVAFYVF